MYQKIYISIRGTWDLIQNMLFKDSERTLHEHALYQKYEIQLAPDN